MKHRGSLLIVIVMWFVSFLVLFGFESKVLPLSYTIVLILAFSLSVMLLHMYRTQSQTQGIWIKSNQGRKKLGLREALPEVVEFVNQHSIKSGYSRPIEVRYIERTWDVLNAFAFTHRRKDFLVLTAGAQALFFSKNEDKQKRFKFLILHELGHVFSKDTSLISIGLVMLWSIVALLPIKFLIFMVFPSDEILSIYASVLPSPVKLIPMELVEGSGFMFSDGDYPNWVGFVMVFVWYILGVVALFFLYRLIISYREHFADQFAAHQMTNKDEAITTLEKMLTGTSETSLAIQSFFGHKIWHPSHMNRLNYIKTENDVPYIRSLSIILISVPLGWHIFTTLGKEDGVIGDSFLLAMGLKLSTLIFLIFNGLWLICAGEFNTENQIRASIITKIGFWMMFPFLGWTFYVLQSSLEFADFANSKSYIHDKLITFTGFISLFFLIWVTAALGKILAKKSTNQPSTIKYAGWSFITFIAWQFLMIPIGLLLFSVYWSFISNL